MRDYKGKYIENPSVGLLLCAAKNDEVVEYAMSRTRSSMLVSQYQLQLSQCVRLITLYDFTCVYASLELCQYLGHKKLNFSPRLERESPGRKLFGLFSYIPK